MNNGMAEVAPTLVSESEAAVSVDSGAAAPVLEARGLGKTFRQGPQEVEVLRGVDMIVRRGERIAIVGSSGSGKSTLLHCLGGLERPSLGEVLWAGQNPMGLSEKARGLLRNRRLGFVYQFHHLLPEFSALENVAMPLLLARKTPQEAEERARALLGELGLAERAEHRPGALSGGEQQRVAVARALAMSPRVLLADEPTGNLDRATGERLHSLLRGLARDHRLSVVIVTHNEDLARGCDRVLRLEAGRLVRA